MDPRLLMRTVLACIAASVALLPIAVFLPFLVLLWMVSAGTRGFARLFRPAHLTIDQLIEFDPVFGWRPRRNLDTHHLSVDLFRIATDGDGWRGRSTIDESDVVVFGDSFAAGYGVGERHFFPHVAAQARIKPIGIGGYSMVQELLWMRSLAPRLRGKLVVWFVYFGNDLYDNITPDLRGYRKPFVRQVPGTSSWEIVDAHVSRQQWPITPRVGPGHIQMVKLAELCSRTFLAERAYRACAHLIREGQAVCQAAGAELVLLTIPDPTQLHPEGHEYLKTMAPHATGFAAEAPDRELAAICASLGVRFVAGASFLDLGCYKQNDCHWNPEGHRRVARWLDDLHACRTPRPVDADLPARDAVRGTREPDHASIP